MAGYIAYSAFLAIFPFMIFATALTGQFVTPEQRDSWVDALFALAPEHIAQTLEPVIFSVTERQGDALVTGSALAALWIASNAVEAIRTAFDRAYGVRRPRHFLLRRAISLLIVVFAVAVFALLGALVVVAPLALSLAEQTLEFRAPFGVGLVRYAIGLTVFLVFLRQLHVLLPSRRQPRGALAPGVFATLALWTLGATGFSVYLAYAPSYSLTYGAFAGVIVTLLFFYLTGAAIIIGAEVNATLLGFRGRGPDGSAR